MIESLKSLPQPQIDNSKSIIDNAPASINSKPSFVQKIWNIIPSRSSKVNSDITPSNPNKPSLLKRICNVAKAILNFGLGLMLYWTNNSLFAISFFVGIIRDDDVAYSIEKVKAVWKTQPYNTFMIGGCGSLLGGLGSVLSLPITLAAGSILYAANLGSNLSKKAQEIMAQRTKEMLIPTNVN